MDIKKFNDVKENVIYRNNKSKNKNMNKNKNINKNINKNKYFKMIKKCIVIVSLIILNLLGIGNSVMAGTGGIGEKLYKANDCGLLLKYKGVNVKVSYIEYNDNGNVFPAYCLNKNKPGAEQGAYVVDTSKLLSDVKLWRIIINGYPYKSIEELGVANRNEAFTATKQAVYCYIHGNKLEWYSPVGEAGKRTLNAMHMILNNANNSNEVKVSNVCDIVKYDDVWKVDSKDSNYVYKTYGVTAKAQLEDYSVKVSVVDREKFDNIKVVDLDNNEKSKFNVNEKFKVMIPINEMVFDGSIKLDINTRVKTKPVLYGKSNNCDFQDYAVTTFMYEDSFGSLTDAFSKNDSKIIVVKKDQSSGSALKGVEFELLNDKKEVLRSGLKTDKDGKICIDNIIPGSYYLKETKSIEGYDEYNDYILVDVKLNEEVTVTVNNLKKEVSKTDNKFYSKKEIKRLPVTGM